MQNVKCNDFSPAHPLEGRETFVEDVGVFMLIFLLFKEFIETYFFKPGYPSPPLQGEGRGEVM